MRLSRLAACIADQMKARSQATLNRAGDDSEAHISGIKWTASAEGARRESKRNAPGSSWRNKIGKKSPKGAGA